MYRLLIVDDEPFMREYLLRFYPWQDMGFTVAGTAANGREALQLLEENPVDVILTDVLMPVMDGIALSQAVSKLKKPPKVLLFSAYADFEYAKQGIESGVAAYILKSDDPQVVKEKFQKMKEELDQETGNTPEAIAGASQVVRNAANYIRQHFRENIQLADVAQSVSVHPVHLSRCLSVQLGKTYTELLTDCRMEEAKRLLRTTDDKVYQIAAAVGYRKSAYFVELFKRYTNATPQQYRDRGWEDTP